MYTILCGDKKYVSLYWVQENANGERIFSWVGTWFRIHDLWISDTLFAPLTALVSILTINIWSWPTRQNRKGPSRAVFQWPQQLAGREDSPLALHLHLIWHWRTDISGVQNKFWTKETWGYINLFLCNESLRYVFWITLNCISILKRCQTITYHYSAHSSWGSL